MVVILSYVDNINVRTIALQKEMNRLKYLLELKKAKRLSMKKTDDDTDLSSCVEAEKNRFETERIMYVGKLNKQEIKAPKLETLQFCNLKFDEESNTYLMLN